MIVLVPAPATDGACGRPLSAEAAREAQRDRAGELRAELTELQRLVRGAEGPGASIDRSDLGAAKRRKLTAQQARLLCAY